VAGSVVVVVPPVAGSVVVVVVPLPVEGAVVVVDCSVVAGAGVSAVGAGALLLNQPAHHPIKARTMIAATTQYMICRLCSLEFAIQDSFNLLRRSFAILLTDVAGHQPQH
jgi:hypothetical protein